MLSNLDTLKAQIKDAQDRADGLWEKFSIFLHAHPKSACLFMLAAGFVIGKIL